MICSFSIQNNDISGGEVMGLIAEGFKDPKAVLGKKCIVKLYEIDTLVGKRKETTSDDLLAEFETEIIQGSRKDIFFFNLDTTKRTDTFKNSLPKPENQTDSIGNVLPVPLDYTPPHFKFYFDSGAPNPKESEFFTILIQSEYNELEMYIYEIGFTVEIGGEIIYDAKKIAAYVNCINILSKNCSNAAGFIKRNHEALISSRNIGTHFGSNYVYELYKNEKSLLEDVSRSEFGRVDVNWINSNTGKYWDESQKIQFDKDKLMYGLQKTSCINFVKLAMQLGFEKTGMNNEWKKIWSKVNNGRGDILAKALTDTGWIALYYNPDVAHPNDDGPVGSKEHTSASEHTFSYQKVKSEKSYYGIKVHDVIINYYPSTISNFGRFRQVPSFFRKPDVPTTKLLPNSNFYDIPFGFIIARGGMHTALFAKGKVLEVHWDVEPYSPSDHPLFDISDFTNRWAWNSGLIVVPAQSWI